MKTLGEVTKVVAGDAPGLDLVIYGGVLIVVVAFAPRGIAGLIRSVRGSFKPPVPANWKAGMAEPLLQVEDVSMRFGGLLAVDRASFAAEAGRITAVIGPTARQNHPVFDHYRVPKVLRRRAASVTTGLTLRASLRTSSPVVASRAHSRSCNLSPR